MTIAEGRHLAKAIDYGMTISDSGKLMLLVKFDCKGEYLIWRGFFHNEKAVEITDKALAVLGMNSENRADLAEGPAGRALNLELEVELTVAHEVYEGNTKAVVKWINEPGGKGQGFKGQIDRVQAAQFFAGALPFKVKPRVDDVPF